MKQTNYYRPGTFVTLPNVHLLPQMRGADLYVYAALCAHTDKEGFCFPSIDKIADLSGYSRKQTFIAIKNLKELGVIERYKQFREDGSQRSNLYRLILVDIPNEGGVIDEGGGYQHDAPRGNQHCTPLTKPIELNKKINKKENQNTNQTSFPLPGPAERPKKLAPQEPGSAVANKTTEHLLLIDALHKTLKGNNARPLKRPEMYVRGLRTRLKDYTAQDIMLAAKRLSAASWYVQNGKNTVMFLLQGNRNTASGDNIATWLEDDQQAGGPIDRETFYGNVMARYGLSTS